MTPDATNGTIGRKRVPGGPARSARTGAGRAHPRRIARTSLDALTPSVAALRGDATPPEDDRRELARAPPRTRPGVTPDATNGTYSGRASRAVEPHERPGVLQLTQSAVRSTWNRSPARRSAYRVVSIGGQPRPTGRGTVASRRARGAARDLLPAPDRRGLELHRQPPLARWRRRRPRRHAPRRGTADRRFRQLELDLS